MKPGSAIKSELFSFCNRFVDDRIERTTRAIRDAQESSNNESKSTAGDKHDTGRAMIQLEVERLSKQLAEAEQMKSELSKINASEQKTLVGPGALVLTSKGNYFISVAAGKIEMEGTIYYAVSALSPIGVLLKNRKKGDTISFNNAPLLISEIQ